MPLRQGFFGVVGHHGQQLFADFGLAQCDGSVLMSRKFAEHRCKLLFIGICQQIKQPFCIVAQIIGQRIGGETTDLRILVPGCAIVYS